MSNYKAPNAPAAPPYSQEAEEAVLGSLLIDPDAILDVIEFLEPEHFYTGRNRLMYETICDQFRAGRATDFVTLATALESKSPDEQWQPLALSLLQVVPTSINIREYARIVEETAIRRRMVQAAGKLATLAHDASGNLVEQLDEAERTLLDVRGNRVNHGIAKPRAYVSDYLNRLEARREHGRAILGLPTGLTDLDRLLEGLQAPHQYILAARPGVGKSALAGNIASHLALKQHKRVMYFSLEMSKDQLTNRMIASMTGIDSRKLAKSWELGGQDMALTYEAAGQLSDSHLFIDPTEGITPAQIRAKCLRIHAEHGLDLVIIDHLHLMRPDRSMNRPDLEFGEITQSLAELGKALNVPVLTLAQLSRSLESRQNKRPQLSDLRESGRIEENAYAVLFLYRDDYHDEMSETPNVAEVIIAKHREGPTGTAQLYWIPKTTSFRNYQGETIDLPRMGGR